MSTPGFASTRPVKRAYVADANPGGGGSVASVFGRTGTISAATGDYTADKITYTPSGTGAQATGLHKTHLSKRFWPEQYGAAADGTTVDDLAFSQAEAAAYAAGGSLVLNPTSYALSTNFTCRVPLFASGAKLIYPNNYNDIALQLGSTTGYTFNKDFYLPEITTAKTGTGWNQANAIAVRLMNLQGCRLYNVSEQNFTEGLRISASGSRGTSYNTIFLGHLENNKKNIHVLVEDDTSWANENTIVGGRFSQYSNEGTNIAGCNQVHIESRATGFGLNNLRFIGVCFEGDGPEYHVRVDGCTDNFFDFCRWEATTPKVYYNGLDATRPAQGNVIMHGYNSGAIVVTQSASNASKNTLVRAQRYIAEGSGSTGYLALSNTSGGTTPVMTVWPSGTNMHSLPTNGWVWAIGDSQLVGKAAADNTTSTGRIWMTPSNGRIYLTDGSALGAYLTNYGGNTGIQVISGDLAAGTAGKTIRIKEGTNAKMGTATLAAGTVTVSNTSVTATSRFSITRKTAGGTLGHLSYSVIAGTSFTITSSSGTDTSTVDWIMLEPA